MEEIPCYIVGESDMSPIRKQLVIEVSNLESRDDYNRDTHRFQVVKLYKQLADEGSIEEKDLVKKIGESLKMSKRYSGMYMTISVPGFRNSGNRLNPEKKRTGIHRTTARYISRSVWRHGSRSWTRTFSGK